MTELDVLPQVRGVACDKPNCTLVMEFNPPIQKWSGLIKAQLTVAGWSTWLGRSVRHYCPDHGPSKNTKMRGSVAEASPMNVYLRLVGRSPEIRRMDWPFSALPAVGDLIEVEDGPMEVTSVNWYPTGDMEAMTYPFVYLVCR